MTSQYENSDYPDDLIEIGDDGKWRLPFPKPIRPWSDDGSIPRAVSFFFCHVKDREALKDEAAKKGFRARYRSDDGVKVVRNLPVTPDALASSEKLMNEWAQLHGCAYEGGEAVILGHGARLPSIGYFGPPAWVQRRLAEDALLAKACEDEEREDWE